MYRLERERHRVCVYEPYGPKLLHQFGVTCSRSELAQLLADRLSRFYVEVDGVAHFGALP